MLDKSSEPKVSVVVPCRNEEGYIDNFIDQVLGQDYSGDFELLIAEGRSSDGTRRLLVERSKIDKTVQLVDNPEGIVPTGLNRAIELAAGEIIVRMDVHTLYAPDYISRCVETLDVTGATNVGGAWVASGSGYLQSVIASAFQSPFSSGGARSHDPQYEGFVDSVYLGCWRRESLLELGLFDEELVRNQDDELNLRTIRAGGKVWQSPSIQSSYLPRKDIVSLFRQYFQYGYWKVRVIQKHSIPASIRHVIPGLSAVIGIVLLALSMFFVKMAFVLAVLTSLYVLVSMLVSIQIAIKKNQLTYAPLLPIIFGVFHVGYAIGTVRGVLDFVILRRTGSRSMKTITR